jgi:peroxiredoxin Q/BCP
MPMVAEGEPAPDFTLPDQDGQPWTLSKLRGRPVVLYFYPRDATPGCTTEACDFRDAMPDYQALGAVVLGVSPDSVASHRKFADKHGLPFTLLADTEKAVSLAYGVYREKTFMGRIGLGIVRTTFVIDGEGQVAKVFPSVKVRGHVQKVYEAVQSLSGD